MSCKPEADSKHAELSRQCRSLVDQEVLEEHKKQEIEKTVKDLEEQWKTLLQTAESTLKKAEVQYFLSREMDAFCTHADSTKTWVESLQEQAGSMAGGTLGTKAQIEERQTTAKVKYNIYADEQRLQRLIYSLLFILYIFICIQNLPSAKE